MTSKFCSDNWTHTHGNSHLPVSSLTMSSRSQRMSRELCLLMACASLCWATVSLRPLVLSQVAR